MRFVLTAAEMRAFDRITIEELGLPGAVLMENAGRAVADAVLEALDDDAVGAHVAVVCGAGNNGGDGFVAARVLREHGVSSTVYLAAPEGSVAGDARTHLRAYEACGGVLAIIADASALAEQTEAIEGADVVVDAVFGTGLTRAVEGHYREVVESINRSVGTVIAADIPSGLAADTGEVLGVATAADRTVSMAFLKVAHAASPGFARCGEVRVAEIGIPSSLAVASAIGLATFEEEDAAQLVPPVDPLDHKGSRGHVLVVGGSPGKRGAGRLSAHAALRGGAGLATWASAGATEVSAPAPLMSAELDCESAGAADVLVELAGAASCVAIGPGMSVGEGGRALAWAALERLEIPLVLDADALNHLGTDLGRVRGADAPVVMTPHPGEAARLLGISTAEIEADRVASVRRIAEQSRSVVLLKGPRTLVCDGIAEDPMVTINMSGGPALATAGSGDVLTGLVAALLAQGLAAVEAARLAAYVHGAAGDAAAARLGPYGVTADDISLEIPAAMARLVGAA